MPTYFPENNTPWQNDDVTRSLQKINGLLLSGNVPVSLAAGTNVIGGVTLTRASTATRSDFTAAVDTQIVAASTTRPMLSIYNVGPAVLRIGLGSTVTSLTNFTYLLNVGDTYVANPNEVTLEHRAIFAAAGSNAEVTIGA
ncbi:MAG: hypothetical protein AN484_06590 [Aphanizomenon flos-aquae WA102]|uniref:Uncharacterized protein n=1 Tax=Aphanizomenon flos-aquae WA102 TaxID=1710896 RepID=A0A1B7X5H3_APHFL|nr:MAG: hypothetical protein AN484_06590 [Aphanizomenon flos-aquae WA102]